MLSRLPAAFAILTAAAACSEGTTPGTDDIDASVTSPPDSGRGTPPPPPPDAAPRPDAEADAEVVAGPDHLLLTEVMTQPFDGSVGSDADFIEIWNPRDIGIDLSLFYLSDSQAYATLPETFPDDIALDFGEDFIVQFPRGDEIAPDQVVVVAVSGEGFEDAYGEPPDYAIVEVGAEATPMEIVQLGTNPQQLGLSRQGSGLVLFHWDGNANLVKDVDMIVSGIVGDDRDERRNILDKSGLEVDGPAEGTGTYRPDAFTMADVDNQFEAVTAEGLSYKRIALEGEHIVASGGNGINGHDETSENIRLTWDNQSDPQAYTPPTPGEIPDSLRQQVEALRGW